MSGFAIGLLTCGREELTSRTLDSFAELNPDLEAHLLHADDASATSQNCNMAEATGFRLVHRPSQRCGQMAALRALVNCAASIGVEFFMLLENDWEWDRALPPQMTMPPEIDVMRLYGVSKDREGVRLAGTKVIGTEHPIRWEHWKAGWQRGLAHFGGPPSIIRLEKLIEAMKNAATMKDISLATRHLRNLRPTRNFVFHIGTETTPGFKA